MLSSRKPLLVCLVASGALLFLGTLALGACNKDQAAAARTSRRGEVCRITSDCAEGLACAPIAVDPNNITYAGGVGVCVTGNFHIRPTAKECAVVDCEKTIDCCDDLTNACPRLRDRCNARGDAGTGSQECIQYNAQCGCETGAIVCEVGKCVSHCKLDEECSNKGLKRCSGGNCVQCTTDPDCGPGGKQCVTGVCQLPCANDGDCSGFDRCLFGRCITSGCQADRECVAVTRNVDARCGTDGKCIVPCETDLECGNPTDYKFFSCIEKQCTYVGCESEKDCRYFFLGTSDASFGPKRHVVCRDKGIIGDVKKPAR